MDQHDKNPSSSRKAHTQPLSGNVSQYIIVILSLTILVLAILLGLPVQIRPFPALSAASNDIEHIPISKVLQQNLQLAKHSWEHGVLTHALLELQNPELTVFAGPGYGFDLHNPNKGEGGRLIPLEPFPNGQLPKCGSGSERSSAGWGRYDDWTKVKGLRYAASKITTSPVPAAVKGGKKGRQWLTESESAADAASLGWAALLLERAGAEDPANPMGVGRNAYGEAADEMVRWLMEENPRFYDVPGDRDGEAQAQVVREVGQAFGTRWAISHRTDSVQLWADSVFMVPPFLAAYAVARQDETWLWEAFEQIKAYEAVLVDRGASKAELDSTSTSLGLKSNQKGLWKHIISQPRSLKADECCHDESYWLTGNAWAVAGIVRVLGVFERWQRPATKTIANGVHEQTEQRAAAIALLEGMANDALASLRIASSASSGLLRNYLDDPDAEAVNWAFGDAAGTALVVSSVYRLAQLHHLRDSSLISWADELYNIVAKHFDENGILGPVTTVSQVPAKESVNATSEGQSFALLMFAARRDCGRLGICRIEKAQNWRQWLGVA